MCVATCQSETVNSLHCAGCGYDLRGLCGERCPECGLPFDPHDPPTARVPWLRRGAELGACSAFWQTVWLALVHPRRLAGQVEQYLDVDAQSARRFRWICTLIAAASVAGWIDLVLW